MTVDNILTAACRLATPDLDILIERLIELRDARDPDPECEPDDEDEELEEAPAVLATLSREDRARLDGASWCPDIDEREEDGRPDDEPSEPGDEIAAALRQRGVMNTYPDAHYLRADRQAMRDVISGGRGSRQLSRGPLS